MQPLPKKKAIADKLFYKIGGVSNIVGVEPYILRYWESEFPFLKPSKNKAGQRVYTKKNLELILEVKNLLYHEKYTIAGVKKKFREDSLKKIPNSRDTIETIERVKKRLREILNTLKS